MIIVSFYTNVYLENGILLQPQFEVLKGLMEEEGAAQ